VTLFCAVLSLSLFSNVNRGERERTRDSPASPSLILLVNCPSTWSSHLHLKTPNCTQSCRNRNNASVIERERGRCSGLCRRHLASASVSICETLFSKTLMCVDVNFISLFTQPPLGLYRCIRRVLGKLGDAMWPISPPVCPLAHTHRKFPFKMERKLSVHFISFALLSFGQKAMSDSERPAYARLYQRERF